MKFPLPIPMKFLISHSLLLLVPGIALAQGGLTYALGFANQSGQSSTAPSLSASYSSTYTSESVQVVYGGVTISGAANCPIVSPGGAAGPLGENASSYDIYTLTVPSGVSGTARFTFHLAGELTGAHTGQGSFYNHYEARADTPGGTVLYTGFLDSTGFFNGTQPSAHPSFTVDVPFASGEPLGIYLAVSHDAGCDSTNPDATPPGDAQCTATIALSCGGFSVLDDQNSPLDYTAESNTGSARGMNIPAGGAFNAFSVSNSAPGRMGSTLSLRDGTASVATNVTAAFVAPPTTQIKPVSDAVELSGTNMDPVVIQISYDAVAAQSIFGSALYLELAWFHNSSGTWKNAVLGNSGTTAPTFFNRAYNPATDFHLGYFGLDTANHVVWAVVNHNSEYVVTVPPPVLAVNSITRPSAGSGAFT